MNCIHCDAPVKRGICTNEACPLSKTNPTIRHTGSAGLRFAGQSGLCAAHRAVAAEAGQ
jgi:hypothetical protein